MGGMQTLAWAATYPERLQSALVIASAARHSAQNIAFHEVGRQAIMADPDWQDGQYYGSAHAPTKGLAVARMAAHITYLSEEGLTEKFGRRLQARRSEEHTSELQSLMRISYAVFCLKKKNTKKRKQKNKRPRH